MKYCRNCHILYSSFAAACPKCGALTGQKSAQSDGEAAQKPQAKAAARDWLWLIIGVPALIAAIYLIARLISRLG